MTAMDQAHRIAMSHEPSMRLVAAPLQEPHAGQGLHLRLHQARRSFPATLTPRPTTSAAASVGCWPTRGRSTCALLHHHEAAAILPG